MTTTIYSAYIIINNHLFMAPIIIKALFT